MPDVADVDRMAVGSYRNPRARRLGVKLVEAEYNSRILIRGIRHASGWVVASVLLLALSTMLELWLSVIALVAVMGLATIQLWLRFRAHELGNIAEVDSLSGREFEQWLGRFFSRLGFVVVVTPYARDFGADLVITWNGIRTAVQAKSGHTNAGVRAVQEALAAKAYYDCERAMVVTTQYFTAEAILLAQAADVHLRSRDDLARELAKMSR